MIATLPAVSALFERRRPGDLEALVGQDKLKRRLRLLQERSGTLGGRAFLVTGKKGMGKTTTARIIARTVADAYCTEEIDAGDLSPSVIDQWRRRLQMRPLGEKGGWALVVNEIHGLTADRARRLLTLIEPPGGLPSFVVIIFTTTKTGQETLFDGVDDAGPLFSRCTRLELEERGQNALIAAHMAEVCRAEGLGEPDVSRVVRLVNEHRGDLRAVYGEIESGFFLE